LEANSSTFRFSGWDVMFPFDRTYSSAFPQELGRLFCPLLLTKKLTSPWDLSLSNLLSILRQLPLRHNQGFSYFERGKSL